MFNKGDRVIVHKPSEKITSGWAWVEDMDIFDGREMIVKEPHIVEIDYYHLIDAVGPTGWEYKFHTNWLEFSGSADKSTTKNISTTPDLKQLNTRPNATNCAKCNGQLKDPGLGTVYKHCPVCEP